MPNPVDPDSEEYLHSPVDPAIAARVEREAPEMTPAVRERVTAILARSATIGARRDRPAS